MGQMGLSTKLLSIQRNPKNNRLKKEKIFAGEGKKMSFKNVSHPKKQYKAKRWLSSLRIFSRIASQLNIICCWIIATISYFIFWRECGMKRWAGRMWFNTIMSNWLQRWKRLRVKCWVWTKGKWEKKRKRMPKIGQPIEGKLWTLMQARSYDSIYRIDWY